MAQNILSCFPEREIKFKKWEEAVKNPNGNNNRNIRFGDISERLKALVAMVKKLENFQIFDDIKAEISRCADAFKQGKKGEAVRIGLNAENWLRASAISFLKNSPKFFESWLGEIRGKNFDSDIVDKLAKEMKDYTAVCNRQSEFDLALFCMTDENKAGPYAYMWQWFRWAEAEQKYREAKRAEEMRKAEESRRAEQRARNQAIRVRQADDLLAAIGLAGNEAADAAEEIAA